MKFTGKYVLRDVLGTHFVVPVGRTLGEKRRCFELSDEGVNLWRAIENGESSLNVFDDEEMREFVDTLKSLDVLM